MKKGDMLELKKRFKKNECTITRMCGCYVDAHKEKVVKINETFLNLADEEFYKYLEIAKKTLSGTIGNNLLQLEYPLAEESAGGHQQFLMGLRSSGLKNEDLLDRLYEQIIESYDYVGNYLILIFHDAYDIMTRTSDKNKLDESEEVYEYILCSICPVELAKPGLGYIEEENRIGVRIRDWIVGAPENGFLFPAFSDHSTDIHSLVYYTKNAKNPKNSFMEGGLGVNIKKTATEQKAVFQDIMKSALMDVELEDGKTSDDLILEIHESLSSMIEEQDLIYEKDRPPIVLTGNTIQEIMEENGISKEVTAKIEQSITAEFGDELPTAENIVDTKALAANMQKKKEKQLVKQVETLKQQLDDTKTELDETKSELDEKTTVITEMQETGSILASTSDAEVPETYKYDIVLRVKPQKVADITTQIINGRKCIVIPVDENEATNINGVETSL